MKHRHVRWVTALAILAGMVLGGCDESGREGGGGTAAAATPPVTPSRQPKGGLDVTFVVTADLHYGANVDMGLGGIGPITKLLDKEIQQVNTIAGRPWPRGVGGKVGTPRGVVVAGDITDEGKKEQWDLFEKDFGLTGKEGKVKFPVFEFVGNHDRWTGEYVAAQVALRHGSRHYSWDWDDLHVICVGEGADDETLRWIAADLAAAGPNVPVVVSLHFSLSGPFSDSNWFGQGDYHDRFAQTLKGYNVIGIFHGHYHASRRYQWRGYDVYCVGSAKHAARYFAVVHVTDKKMTVGSWHWSDAPGWWWHHEKALGPVVPAARE